MQLDAILQHVRTERGWSLRRLAHEAHTSHATLSAYAHARVDPSVGTLDRIVERAGFVIEPAVVRRNAPVGRGQELLDVLELAAAFPARHSPRLDAPVFPRQHRG